LAVPQCLVGTSADVRVHYSAWAIAHPLRYELWRDMIPAGPGWGMRTSQRTTVFVFFFLCVSITQTSPVAVSGERKVYLRRSLPRYILPTPSWVQPCPCGTPPHRHTQATFVRPPSHVSYYNTHS
jgi:hypothetical protein